MLLLVFLVGIQANSFAQKWVGTWSCAPYAADNNTPPSPYLENNTLRQVVRTSIGGDTIRVKFSNITSSTPVTMNSVNIAALTTIGGSAIDTSTITTLKFNGNESVTMNAYSDLTSDPIAFVLTPGMHLAITIFYGECKTAADMTFHYGSRCDSYILEGDQSQSETFAGATPVERWYTINTIDVLAPDSAAAVAVFGNSITDGYGIHGGLKNTFPDMFSKNVLANESTLDVAVLNMGIGATWVTTSGVKRFQQDVLDQNGMRWIVVFYGVNDIGGGASANVIISAYRRLIAQAHAANIRIYGGTITPFKGHGYYSEAHEATRTEVNEWIRTSGSFDAIIDFDQVIRDPADPEKLQVMYSNDWLHPNADGYKLLGESIDLNLFLGGDTIFEQANYETHYFEAECATVGSNWDIIADEQASNGSYVTAKVESKEAAPISEEGLITIPFSVDESGEYDVFTRLNCPSPDDDSFWVKVDNNEFELKNGLGTNGWGWISIGLSQIEKGEHTLSIGYREDGAKLDKIAISNSPFPPVEMGEDAENSCIPKVGINSIELEDNKLRIYPNPADSKTNIEFSLENSSNVSLKIYDNIGKKIVTLIDDEFEAGSYVMNWDASKISGGNYTCKFIAGNNTISQKMVLLD